MKLLVIGTDSAIFTLGSEARSRIDEYGRLFESLAVIVYTSPGFQSQRLPSGAAIHPTNSSSFLRRPLDAYRIGRRIIREQGVDLISVQDPAESGIAGWLLKRITGLPLHVQLHTDFLSPHFRRNSWKERLRYWLARRTIPHADAIRAVSARIQRSLSAIRYPLSAVTVLPIFVDRAAIAAARPALDLHQRYPEFDFTILVVARLVREKNIGLAIEAFAELLKEFPETGLVIVGDGPERKNLEFRIQNLELSQVVRLEGWQEDLVSYYKTSDLYLLTSNFEGYGRSVVEAAACGLPIVMTDVGVAGELIRDGETGRVVPVGERAALVEALRQARSNYPKVQRMAGAARAEALAMLPRTREEYLTAYRESFTLSAMRHPEGPDARAACEAGAPVSGARRISRDSSPSLRSGSE